MRFTIKLKLILTFTVMILLLLGTAGLGVKNMSSLNQAITDLIAGPAKRLELAEQADVYQLQMIRAQKNLLLAAGPTEIAADKADGDAARERMADDLQKGESIATEQGKPMWAKARVVFNQFIQQDDQIRKLVEAGSTAQAIELSSREGRKLADEMDKEVGDLVALQQTTMHTVDKETDAQYFAARNLVIGLTVVALLIAA